MRATFLIILSFLAGQLLALSPEKKAPLIDHLMEVNQRWKYVEISEESFLQEVSFPDDIARIARHLESVEAYLRKQETSHLSPEQKQNRMLLLDQLASYQSDQKFPINLYHNYRRPYFIDDFGTACAVGHLIQKSGNQAFAKRISQEMNYAYLLDMPYPEIDSWAEKHGFTKEELALIQPGYSPNVNWESLGAGADGEITALYGDEANQRLILAGNFSTLGEVPCNQVGSYANGSFLPLGNGVQGEIYDIISFEGNIYLGGLFSNSSNIAYWDGQSWNYEQLGMGRVYEFEIDGNYLIAAGDFTHDPNQNQALNFIARKLNGSWAQFGNLSGPVYSISWHQDEIFLGGDFNVGATPSYVQKLNGNNWVPATHQFERLDAPVRSLLSDGNFLYASGNCRDENSEALFCFARLGNSGWERLMDYSALSGKGRIDELFLHEGRVLVAGDFSLEPFVGIYGGGIAKFRDNPNFPNLEAIADLDSTVHAVASVNGELFIGGAFYSQFPFQPDTLSFLAKTPNLTSIDPEELKSISIYPNPLQDKSILKIEGQQLIDRVEAFDLSGRLIRLKHKVNGNEVGLEREGLPSGVLIVKVWGKEKILAAGKLLVE